jgi:hypothetical protein
MLPAPVGLESLDVEAQRLCTGPEVRIVEMALVGEDGIVEGPERALRRSGLGGAGQRDGPGMLGLERKMAESDTPAFVAERQRGDRAARARHVGVHDHELPHLAAHMVVGPKAGNRRSGKAAFVHAQGQTVPPAMKVHLLQREQILPAPPERVFGFFADARNLEAITPPLLRFSVVTPEPIHMTVGRLIHYRLRLHGVPISWLTSIEEWEPPYRFVDVQVRGPYALWHHTHEFEPIAGAGGPGAGRPGSTLMRDTVRYAIGFGTLGTLAARAFVHRDVAAIFDFRASAVVEALRRGGCLEGVEDEVDAREVPRRVREV